MSLARANPSDLRRAMEAAHLLVKTGILFVPVPILGAKDHDALASSVQARLLALERMAIQQSEESDDS
jgi:hypothetical protein